MATLEDLLIKIGIDAKGVDKGGKEAEGKLASTFNRLKGVAAAGGLAAGAALMGGLNQVIEQSKPMALLQAQLGAGSPIAGEAGKAAGMVYKRGFVGTIEEATDAVRAAVQNALVPPTASSTEIDKVAARISTLAGTMQEDAGRVSAAVSQMIRTGLVDSAQEGFDLLQRGVEMGVNKSEDLLDTFNEYGTQFRQIGIDGPTAMGMLSQALKAGARDSDTAADALKEFALRGAAGGKDVAAAFKAAGVDATWASDAIATGGPEAAAALDEVLYGLRNMEAGTDRTAAAVALFGPKAEDMQDALFAMDPDSAAKGLGNLAGAAENAGNTLEQSAGAKLEAFKRAAQGALVDQMAKAIPYLEATFGFLQRNSAWVKPLVIGLGALAVVIGVITAAQWAWNAAMAVSPVTWVIAAIVALIAVIVLIATKTRFFQNTWAAVWGFMKGVGAWFAGPFANFFVQLWNKITASLNRAKSQLSAGINAIKSFFVSWYNKSNEVMAKVIGKGVQVVNWFKALPGRIGGALRNTFSGLWTGFKAVINRIIAGWNNLSFKIGGGSFAGVKLPSTTINTPNIPYLAEGALVTGPTLAMIGEGREDEVVAPLSKVPELGGDERTVVIELAPGGEREFRRWVNKTIRARGAFREEYA